MKFVRSQQPVMTSVIFRLLYWFYWNECKAYSDYINATQRFDTQSCAFVRGELKSQRHFLHIRRMTSFANKMEILLW
jgi:hypothetical protein